MKDLKDISYSGLKKKIDRNFKYSNLLKTEIGYPENKFLIYTRGRTGSTLLTELLNCHPEMFCDVEIFNLIYSKTKVRFPLHYIKSCSKRATLNKRSVYGFKVKISQLRFEHNYNNYKEILSELNDLGWKFIYLKRLNYLRHKISNFMTTQTNIFHLKDGDKYDHKITVDCKELMRGIVYSEEVERNERDSLQAIDHLELIYERDILDSINHQETADKAFKFLGMSSCKVSTNYRRIIPDNLEEIVLNYDEVYNFFKETKYAEFLK